VKRPALLFIAALASLLLATAPVHGAPFDRALWNQLLEAHTRTVDDAARVRVDYAAIALDPRWKQLIASVQSADPRALAGRAQTLAFWIDVYNILAIDLVARHYPVDGIRDIGSLFRPVWDRAAGRVGDSPVTLGQIEHEILRPLGDPRIHAAIVCASVSCPPLGREAYEPSRLDDQLDAALRAFLAIPEKGSRYTPGSAVLQLSRIFDWFAEDFEASGGIPEALRSHLPDDTAAALDTRPRIRFMDYDWSLNGLP
jgi:hypothetical protein